MLTKQSQYHSTNTVSPKQPATELPVRRSPDPLFKSNSPPIHIIESQTNHHPHPVRQDFTEQISALRSQNLIVEKDYNHSIQELESRLKNLQIRHRLKVEERDSLLARNVDERKRLQASLHVVEDAMKACEELPYRYCPEHRREHRRRSGCGLVPRLTLLGIDG